jgi:ParB family transcriptional regulator, chromosome partitioning protein
LQSESSESDISEGASMRTEIEIPITAILPNPWQPREQEDPEHIKKIALSIAQDGLMQIPVGRWVFPDGNPVKGMGSADLTGSGLKVQLAFGHSRLAAFKWLEDVKPHSDLKGDWARMPVILADLDDEEMFRMAITENIARKDLSPLEQARSMKAYRDQFGKTSSEIGELYHLGESTVRNKIRLLELPAEIQAALADGTMPEGVGRELLTLYDLPASTQKATKTVWLDGGRERVDLLKWALEQHPTAEAVRKAITSLVKQEGRDLYTAKWKLDDRVDASRDERVRCELCSECDHLVRREKLLMCLDPACHAARTALWNIDRLQAASEVCGIQPASDIHRAYFDYSKLSSAALESARRAGCENLRLVTGLTVWSTEAHMSVPGFEDVQIYCAKRRGYCTCQSGHDALARQQATPVQAALPDGKAATQTSAVVDHQPTAEDLREASRERRREEKQNKVEVEAIREDYARRLANAFLDRNPTVMIKLLLGNSVWGDEKKELKKAGPFEIVLARAKQAAFEINYGAWDPTAELRRVNAFLAEAGLPLMESQEEATDGH